MKSRAVNGMTCAIISLFVSVGIGAPQTDTDEKPISITTQYAATGGTVELRFDPPTLDALGWKIASKASSRLSDVEGTLELPVDDSSVLAMTLRDGVFHSVNRAAIATFGAILIENDGNRIAIGNFMIEIDDGGRWVVTNSIGGSDRQVVLRIASIVIDAPARTGSFALVGELAIAATWADSVGRGDAADVIIGSIRIRADIAPVDSLAENSPTDAPPVEDQSRAVIGPDVIVGDLYELASYGSANGIAAFAVGTVSCNRGDENLNWIAETSDHPVIAQSMYKLYDGRLTNIGQSWLKHGFFALSGTLCSGAGGCTGDPSGDHLGPGCSDPYSAGLNGSQGNLGPRSDVDPYTGLFPFPFSAPTAEPTIGRRLQVHHEDLDPLLNPGALYFVEGQYVAADDASADHATNNASYRPVTVAGSGSSYSISLAGATHRELPAIFAWSEQDPTVTVDKWGVPNEGLFWLAYKVTDLADGWYRYDYAVQNLNSDRAGSEFSVPLYPGTPTRNIGFHDVDSHSGEPYELTDWAVSQVNSTITWSTESCTTNPNTNALRWGTMYNFWFETSKRPELGVRGEVTLRLCKAGTPDVITRVAVVPEFTANDCNNNGIPDDQDIANGTSQDCTGNLVPDECEGDDDGDGIWNPCDVCPLGDDNLDQDGDGVPDACDQCQGFDDALDFDGDGRPDGCDNCPLNSNPSQADADGDGIGNACDADFCAPFAANEHFDTDPDWIIQNAGATDGDWEWGDPAGDGTRQDPTDDFDGGGACYLTDNLLGNSDVDGGTTRLWSPVYDLSAGPAQLTYAYWIGTTDTLDGDELAVDVTDDGGTTWIPLARYTTNVEAWLTDSFALDDFITNPEAVQVRFSATDGGSATVLEAGIDAFEIAVDCAIACTTPADCFDGNPCTDDDCVDGACSYLFNTIACDDGDDCTTNDVCVEGICTGGPMPSCLDTTCTDCNLNGFKDQCEGLADCNGNNYPDICEYTDCNDNGIADVCDVAAGAADCDGGPIGDLNSGADLFAANCAFCHGADGSGGFGPDIRDHSRVQIWNQLQAPTTHTGGVFGFTQQDFADIETFLSTTGGTGRPNLLPDSCETLADCDGNGASDGCELGAGSQDDLNLDGIPDQCTHFNAPVADVVSKNRYLEFIPGTLITGAPGSQGFRVTSLNFSDVVKWIGPPDAKGVSLLQCTPFYRDWGSTTVLVADQDIVPNSAYTVEGIVENGDILNETLYTDPVVINTVPAPTPKWWADIVGISDGVSWYPPNGVLNFDDVYAAILGFSQSGGPVPPLSWADVEPEVPNRIVNINDVYKIILAFTGKTYPYADPTACP